VTGSLDSPVLILNRNYQAIRVTTARQAFEMLYMERALALDGDYEGHNFERWAARVPDGEDECIGIPGGRLVVPRILLLMTYNRVPRAPIRLSRRSLFMRDGYQCQYCGVQPPVRELNIDHVVPRSRGGGSTWENLVTSCRTCNLRKGRALTHECGMEPMNRPRRPKWTLAVHLHSSPRRYREWEPFLGLAAARRPALAG